MIKDIRRGINIGLGFILVIGLMVGVVFAIGFHSADEILGGNFSGNYLFTGDVNFTGSVTGAASGGSIPIGSTMAFFTANCPTGWLKTNGSAISRTTYSDLFGELGVMYGNGDGSTTFNLPDTRGYFLRSWAEGSTMDPDRASRTDRGDGVTGDNVGTIQSYQLQSHRHEGFDINHNNPDCCSGTGVFGELRNSGNANPSSSTWSSSPSYRTAYSGGSETRPRNINVLYCIKY